MHESVDESAINEAKEDSAVNQDFEPATSEVVHGCSSKSDEKVQDDPQRRSLRAATVRFHAENPASDGLRDANGLLRTVNQDRVNQVESTNDQSAKENSGEWSRSCGQRDRKSTRLNSSHVKISYAVFCLKKKKQKEL